MASRSRSPRRSASRGRSYSRSPTLNSRIRSRSPSRRSQSPRSVSSRGRRNNGTRRARSDSQSPARSTKIVVERLTKNVNENHLWEIFGAFGPIRDISLPMNKQYMTNRGTAYIVYHNVANAEDAIAYMHEAQLDGTHLAVSVVLPRRRLSVSPPPSRRVAAFDERESQRRPPPSSHRVMSPPTGPRGRSGYARGGQSHGDSWRRSYSRSRSRSPYRSRSYSSRSRSFTRSPPPGTGRYRRRSSISPPPAGGRRRSPSYNDRFRSRDGSYSRDRGPPSRR